MKAGQLDVRQVDMPYLCVVQLRHQTPGVLHTVTIRPDKIRETTRQCSLGHFHASHIVVLGETPGDQAAGWQYPENVYVVAVLGKSVEKDGQWECIPLE